MSTSKFSDPFMMKDPLSPLQGNAFIKAKIDAENAGKTSFSFNGRNYPLKMEEDSPLNSHRFDHVIDPENEKLFKQFRKNKSDWEKSLKNKKPENRKTRDSLYGVYANTASKINDLPFDADIPKDIQGQIMDGFDF